MLHFHELNTAVIDNKEDFSYQNSMANKALDISPNLSMREMKAFPPILSKQMNYCDTNYR